MIWWFSNLPHDFLKVSKQILSLTAATKETLPLLQAFTTWFLQSTSEKNKN